MKRLSDNMHGAALMMGAMAAFTLGDAAIKALGGSVPLAQILTLRGVFATACIAGMAAMLGQWRVRLPRGDVALVAARSLAEAVAAYFFLTALLNMPFANVTALLQMLPLAVTLGSALVFRDPVGWRRWTAIAIGFAGMLLIVRPGTDGFDAWSLYALVAVACVTVRDLVTRRMSSAVPSLMVTFWSSAAVLVFAALWSLGGRWVAMDGRETALVLAAGGLIVIAYSLSVAVMRVGEISFIAPFRYTGLVWALILGYLLFGEWPDLATLLGATIIMGTGIFTLWREARRGRSAVARAAAPGA